MLRTCAFALLSLFVVGSLQVPAPWLVPSPALAVIGPCTPGFSQPTGSPINVADAPVAVVASDFDGDSRLDLAVAHGTSSTALILLGNGSGGFTQEGLAVPAGIGPSAMVAGDFNGDGRPDLAVAGFVSNDVTILLRHPLGGFLQEGAGIPIGDDPAALAVGDFNGDGRSDLAVGNSFTDSVTIHVRNLANTGFTQVGAPIGLVGHAASVAVGHFNTDANVDLAVALSTSSTIAILLGNGNGTFVQAPLSPIAVPSLPVSVVAASFNGDGFTDLAVASSGADSVSILLGNGSGSFGVAAGSPITVGDNPFSLAVGSFDDDGDADLAVANNGSNTVSILLGSGSGGFAPAAGSPVASPGAPRAVAVGRFNGDNALDLAVANIGADTVTVVLNSCLVADLGVSIAAAPEAVVGGPDLTYTVTVTNAGPDPAATVVLTDVLPASATFVSLTAPGGWSCTTPSIGAIGKVTCSISALPVGSSTLTLVVRPTGADTLNTTVTVEAVTADGSAANNSASTNTTARAPAPVPTATPGVCAPRPRLSMATIPAGPGRLQVTIATSGQPATPGNRLQQLRATVPGNARLDVPGGPNDLSGQATLPVGDGTQPVVFFVRRVGDGAVTVPLVAVDACGEWSTFVGGGSSAF